MAGKVLVVALLLAIGLVAYDDIARQNNFPPRPSRFFGVALIFSVLAVVAVPAPALAAAFAVAVDIAFALRGTGQGQPAQSAGTPPLASGSAQVPQPRGSSTVTIPAGYV